MEVHEVPDPQPEAGGAVVRVRDCGICGSDLHFYHGSLPCPAVCPGHEISGEVAAVGPGVKTVRPGDRVAIEPLLICGECPACRAGNYQICRNYLLIGTQADGGFAEYIRVPERALFPLPAELDWPVAALTEPTAVAVHGARLAGVRLGDRVAVLGAGTIGLLSVLAARAAGASEVLVTARHPHQRAAAESFGARAYGDSDHDALSSYAIENPIDVVVESVGGTADTLSQALFLVRPGGTICVLGVFAGPVSIHGLVLVMKEARLVGSLTYGRTEARADFEVAIELLRQHRQEAARIITHRYPLRQIDEAFRTASDKKRASIKVTVEP